jgi:hypothetical protein
MISTKENTALKKIFGNHYTSNVIEVLVKNNVKDTSGKTHSAEFIRQVFKGYREHEAIELAILEAAAIEKKRKKELARKKKQILKSA